MRDVTPRNGGFTLVELVVAMSLATIVVAFMAMFITSPVHAYRGQVRRAEMVDTADNVLRDMARDIRSALPNSVRVATNGNISAIEMLAARDAVRYRSGSSVVNAAQQLDFTMGDSQFTTIGCLDTSSTVRHLSIYNIGIAGANAYQLANVMTPATTSVNIGACVNGETQITLSAPFRFAYESPQKRLYLVTGPVTYLCDQTAGTLTRYSGYSISPGQPTTAAAMSTGTSALVAQNISGCNFDYQAGSTLHAGLVTLAITITRTDPAFSSQAEQVRLLHQVHVENAP